MKKILTAAAALLLLTVLAAPLFAAAEIIMDNPDAVMVGTWATGTTAATRYGPDYYYCYPSASNGRTATYRPVIPETSDDWQVYIWYPMGTNRTTQAQYIVHSADGDDYHYINQQQNGGMWVYLGTYTMNAGTESYVRIVNYGTETSKVLMADAARFYSASGSQGTAPPEFRTIWVDTWGNGFLSAAEITQLVNTLKTNNYNAFIPEVRKRGDAYYNASPIYCPACGLYHQEPRASNIIDPPPWDPLADAVTKAHAQGIEVHPWIVAYKIWTTSFGTPPPDHVWAHHPEWALTDSGGGILEGSNYALDPGIPAVQDYICKVVLDIVGNYDVDGLNFDYIRYPGTAWGYNAITEQRFYDEYGFWPPTSSGDPNWGTWCDYRRQQVTDLVKKCYLEVMAIKPHVKISACLTSWGGLYPSYNFENTDTYKSVFQNWPVWAQGHFIDALMPMDYKREHVVEQARDYRDWIDFAVANKNGRHVYNGQGSYLNTIANSMIQMQAVRDHGADGISNYSYRVTNSEGLPNSDFFDAVRTTHYTSPVPTPDMPWKSAPTTGIIFGTVTDASQPNDPIYLNWIYKATVEVSGPVTQSTLTDATGTYGFLDLPPGAYTITCSKAGFPTQVYDNQTIAAGDVLREDFDLGYVTASSPSSAVNPAWALFSLPMEPVNPDPASVLSGISLDYRLFRWDKPTQSLVAYDELMPGDFGSMNLDEGYWLYVDSPYTINYQAYGGSAPTRTVSLPRTGWSIIGCPFLIEKNWADMQVTQGSTTVSLETARNNGWIYSIGYYWDSSTQSLVDVGLPDDLPTSTTLQPWHGHWVRTYVDALTLTLR